MRDLLTQDGKPVNDLSKRMADNVVEALVTYLQAPGSATGEQVTVLSAALQSLATLAIAEQLQALAVALAPDDEVDSREFPAESYADYMFRVYGESVESV